MPSNLITIGIPCYNEELYIEKCLASAIQQDIKGNYSVIISDNASTDKTVKKIKNIMSNHNSNNCKISLFENTQHASAHENLKRVFDISKSKYFLWLGAHDIITKDFISKSIGFLEANSDYSMVSGIPYGFTLRSSNSFTMNLKSFAKDKLQLQSKTRMQKQLLSKRYPILWNEAEDGWGDEKILINAIYDFSQDCPFERYMNSVRLLSNCTIFHSVFKIQYLDDYDWSNVPSADHIIISRLLWHGKLKYSTAGYMRRYFPKEVLRKKVISGSYIKNINFFESYLRDFENLSESRLNSQMQTCSTQLIYNSLVERFGLPPINV